MTTVDENSKRTRIEPVFRWLRESGGAKWPRRLLELSDLADKPDAGRLKELTFEKEVTVEPSRERLAWMLLNVESLVPQEGERWRQLRERTLDSPDFADLRARLERREDVPITGRLILEGRSHADCLVDCERLVIWIEGKRNDWPAPSTTWDSARDQLARNTEAAWTYATKRDKDFRLLVCHEARLKHHEPALVDGYRSGTWSAGWPHLDHECRAQLGSRIGTLTWGEIVSEWPGMRSQPELGGCRDARVDPKSSSPRCTPVVVAGTRISSSAADTSRGRRLQARGPIYATSVDREGMLRVIDQMMERLDQALDEARHSGTAEHR